jgi:transcriptional regulator with XRE-family HTH domain
METNRLTQADLARMTERSDGTNPTPGAINNLLAGRKQVGDHLARSIASALNVDVTVLFSMDAERPRQSR